MAHFFVQGKMPNPTKQLSAHQVYCKTLNSNFSASKQNVKNLVGDFGAIYVGIMHAKFQPSSLNGVKVGGCDRWMDRQGTSHHISNFPPHFALEG